MILGLVAGAKLISNENSPKLLSMMISPTSPSCRTQEERREILLKMYCFS